jgi:hypothetical protein
MTTQIANILSGANVLGSYGFMFAAFGVVLLVAFAVIAAWKHA